MLGARCTEKLALKSQGAERKQGSRFPQWRRLDRECGAGQWKSGFQLEAPATTAWAFQVDCETSVSPVACGEEPLGASPRSTPLAITVLA
eukprot:170116-Pleurochrysis_carterae.AAC.3